MRTDESHSAIQRAPEFVPVVVPDQALTRRAVLLFARAPLNDARAKPIAGLNFAERIKLFTSLTRHALRSAAQSGFDLIVATDAAVPMFRDSAVHILTQWGEGFGERLRNAVSDVLALGYDEVAVIGNDSPELDGKSIRQGLTERLPGSIGLCRAADGGVTLIALDRTLIERLPTLFSQPRWETSFLFDDLVDLTCAGGVAVEDRGEGNDIDSLADLIRLATSSSSSSSVPEELRRVALLFLPTLSTQSTSPPYRQTLRRTLRTCRQKAPPLSLFSPSL